MAEVTEMFSAPLTFNWTLSYRCNFTCEHCYSRDEQCPELATADVKRIIDILVEQQVPFINFGGGEPLMRKDLFEKFLHDNYSKEEIERFLKLFYKNWVKLYEKNAHSVWGIYDRQQG